MAVCIYGWIPFGYCLSQCPIAVKRRHDHSNFYKRQHLVGGLLTVSEVSSNVIVVGEQGSTLADTVLERLRVLDPDPEPQGAGRRDTGPDWNI